MSTGRNFFGVLVLVVAMVSGTGCGMTQAVMNSGPVRDGAIGPVTAVYRGDDGSVTTLLAVDDTRQTRDLGLHVSGRRVACRVAAERRIASARPEASEKSVDTLTASLCLGSLDELRSRATWVYAEPVEDDVTRTRVEAVVGPGRWVAFREWNEAGDRRLWVDGSDEAGAIGVELRFRPGTYRYENAGSVLYKVVALPVAVVAEVVVVAGAVVTAPVWVGMLAYYMAP